MKPTTEFDNIDIVEATSRENVLRGLLIEATAEKAQAPRGRRVDENR